MWFHNWEGLKPPHRNGACTDCFTQGLEQGRMRKGSPRSCLLPAAVPCHLLMNEDHFDTSPFPPELTAAAEWWIYIGEKTQHLPAAHGLGFLPSIASAPHLEESLPASLPTYLPLLQPLPQPSLPWSSWHPSPLLCHRSLQAIALCLTASLSKGRCNQNLTPLLKWTQRLTYKLYGWIFVATRSSLCKGFRDGGY